MDRIERFVSFLCSVIPYGLWIFLKMVAYS